jgi:quercetin dioxygenase-like cupin family protein
MDPGTTALSAAIGGRVNELRRRRRWTLDQLAGAAGVSRRMVVNVEQGAVNPSVGTLLRISDALGVGLPALVEQPDHQLVQVTPSGGGAALWTGPAGGRGVLVAGTEPPDVLELWEWTLGADERHHSEAHAAGTRELLQVHEGRVTLEVADQTFALEPGDAVSFPGDVPHAYASCGAAIARFSLAVFEPGVGSARPKRTPARP